MIMVLFRKQLCSSSLWVEYFAGHTEKQRSRFYCDNVSYLKVRWDQDWNPTSPLFRYPMIF